MRRRDFLQTTGGLCLTGWAAAAWRSAAELQTEVRPAPTHSIVPVVGDGKWIWTEPPANSTGYLEPRSYDLHLGFELEGTGSATRIRATTAAPGNLPEQEIVDVKIDTEGCEAGFRVVSPEAGQLMLAAPGIEKGTILRAVAKYRLKISKEYQGHERDRFPGVQKVPKEATPCLIDSPGIQTKDKAVREIVATLVEPTDHPWDKAKKFHTWVWENIQPQVGWFTSVLAALKTRKGDCEERAAVFVAFCRAAGIPARLVWVPNHNWAEFWLHDEQGKGAWIPAHTSAYAWFGYTGAHELVLQKGDSLSVPEERRPLRLLADWMQWQGARPKVRYVAELKPVAEEGTTDAGPGARSKDKKGEWVVVSDHPADKYGRK